MSLFSSWNKTIHSAFVAINLILRELFFTENISRCSFSVVIPDCARDILGRDSHMKSTEMLVVHFGN